MPSEPKSPNKLLAPGYENEEGPLHTHSESGELIVDFTGDSAAADEIHLQSQKTLQSAKIDAGTGYPAHLVWTTKDGRRIPIPHMQDSHLLNVLAFLRRRVSSVYKKRLLTHMIRGLLKTVFTINTFDLDDGEGHMDDHFAQMGYNKIREAGEKVFDMNDDDFLRAYHPQFPYLYQEAYRRKLLIEGSATDTTNQKVIP